MLFSRCWDLLIHHGVCLCTIGTVAFFDYYHGFSMIALLMEVNTVLLHLRTLLKLAKQCNTRAYRINSVVNIVTLIMFRILESVKIYSFTEIGCTLVRPII